MLGLGIALVGKENFLMKMSRLLVVILRAESGKARGHSLSAEITVRFRAAWF